MTTTALKSKILKRVERASEVELNQIFNYIETLKERDRRKKEILSLAGSWKDIKNDLFSGLTKNLIRNRKSRRDVLR